MPPKVPFNSDRADDPAFDASLVTPSDTVDLPQGVRGLWIGGAGNVNVQFAGHAGADGATVLISAVPAGTLLPVRARRVFATSTTATLIVAFT